MARSTSVRWGVVVGLVALAACEPASQPAGPDGNGSPEALAPAASVGPSGFNVYNFQLRASSAGSSTAYGHMQLRVGTRHPPNPCAGDLGTLAPGDPRVAACGVIHNPAEETFVSGVITAGATADVLVPFSLQHPPNPCRTLRFAGALAITQAELDALTAHGADPGAAFFTLDFPDGSAIGGSTATTPPPPDDPSRGERGPAEEPVCSADVVSPGRDA